jgi:succinyl-diaminopimelate desuccinylase
MEKNSTYENLIKIVDAHRNDLVDLCLQLGNTPSPHAQEKKLGEAVLDWLSRHGIKGDLQFITEQSVNAVATIPGTANGKSLIWNAHMDTGPELGPGSQRLR